MIYTIGFTKKTAEKFFGLISENNIEVLIDVRLNNTSQLAGFAKYPDIEYFSKSFLKIDYIHDITFAPTEELLKNYKSQNINWNEYEETFHQTMTKRKIKDYIKLNYKDFKDHNICLLCSEETADCCHRRLIAEYFSAVFKKEIKHI